MKNRIYFLSLVLVLIAACTTPSVTTEVSPTSMATQTPSSAPTFKPTQTKKPTATPIPGFEEWSVFNPGAVDISTQDDALVLKLKYGALWFMNRRGVLLYKLVDGDFKITADVFASKSSDPSQPPGGEGIVQLGGLMARNGEGGPENYVFIVVGDDGDGLSVETKNTTDNFSAYDGPSWDTSNASLRLCRSAETITLYKRPVGTNEPWTLAGSFERPDLPSSLQVGLNIYSGDIPDLQVRYENIKIEPITSVAECEME